MSKLLLTSTLALSLGMAPMLVAQNSQTIRDAQQALKDKGFDPGSVDGVMGPKTRSAITQYQKQSHLAPDGHLGKQTLATLGVKESTDGRFQAAGSNLKNGYGSGGKQVGEGGKALGSGVAHGNVVEGAKDFGKGVGGGVAKMGTSTGHAAKNAAKGTKNVFTGDKKKDE